MTDGDFGRRGTMKKILGGAAAALLVVAGVVGLTGFAGGCGGHGGWHGRDPARMAGFVTDRVDDLLDDVDATPEQRTRIQAVKDRLLAAGEQARGGRREAHEAVVAEWKAETPDAARLHALVDARVEEMRALAHQAVDAGVEVHGVLTPEQRERLSRKAERWHR
jgi:Spy/CpxP family protein refolding chaperone